jgi:xanthine dehydrogenase accessory factor
LRRRKNLDKYIVKLHMPAGIDINSNTPEEIAISILAEIICVLKKCMEPIRSMTIAKKWWETYKIEKAKKQ